MTMWDLDELEAAEPDAPPGPTFKLKGQTFACLARPPVWSIYSMLAGVEESKLTRKMQAALAFIRGVLVPEDEERFEDVMRNKRDLVSSEQVFALFQRLMDHYVSPRPTSRPSGSAGGPSNNGDGSADASDSPASIPPDSASEDGST